MSKKKLLVLVAVLFVVAVLLITFIPTSSMNKRLDELVSLGYKTTNSVWSDLKRRVPPGYENRYIELSDWSGLLTQAFYSKILWEDAGLGDEFAIFFDKEADIIWLDVPMTISGKADPSIDYNMILYYDTS